MLKKGLISLALMVCLIWIVFAMQGCGEGDNQLLSEAMRDDGIEPAMPTWKSIPYDIEKISLDRYRVTLYWNKVGTNKLGHPKNNIAGYKILKSDVNENLIDTFWTGSRSGATAEYYIDTDTGNTENKRYIYRVIAFDTYLRESSASSPQLINIIEAAGEKPRSPSDFNYVVENEHTVTLYWKPVTSYQDGTAIDQNLKGYEIYRAKSTTRPDAPHALVSQEHTSFSDSELDYDETYYYWIASVDESGAKSAYSDPLSVRIQLTSAPTDINDVVDYMNNPTSPHITGVTSINNSNGTVTWSITWESPIYNDDKTAYEDHKLYKIFRSESPEGFFQLMAATSDTQYSFTVPTIVNYYFRLTAVDKYGNESLPSGTGYDKASLPDVNSSALELRIGPSDDEEVNIRWQDIGVGSELDYYYLYRSLKPVGPYQSVGSGIADDDRSTEYDYTDVSVISGVTYYYRMRGSNTSGLSGYTYYATSGTTATTANMEAELMTRSGGVPWRLNNDTPITEEWPDNIASSGQAIRYLPDEGGPDTDDYVEWRSPDRKPPRSYKIRLRYKNIDSATDSEDMGTYRVDVYQENAWVGNVDLIGAGPGGTPLTSFSCGYVAPGTTLPDGTTAANNQYIWTDWQTVTITENINPFVQDRYLYFQAVWQASNPAPGSSADTYGKFYFDAAEIQQL